MHLAWLTFRALRSLPLIGVILLAVLAPGAIALGQQTPRDGQPVIVVTAPWETAMGVTARADGRLITPGRTGWIALVWSDKIAFTDSLYDAGAWLVLRADLSDILCRTG